MDSHQSKPSAFGLIFFFNLHPLGNLFTGQRPKNFYSLKENISKIKRWSHEKPKSTKLKKKQTNKLLKNLNFTDLIQI